MVAFALLVTVQTGAASGTVATSVNAPLYFEANHGQAGAAARFIARGQECSVLLAPAEATLILATGPQPLTPPFLRRTAPRGDGQPFETRAVRLRLRNGNPRAAMTGLDELPGKANYLLGNDPADWRAGVPLFSRVQVEEIYPGIGLVYHADDSARLEYDFIVQPHADPDQISFVIEGADRVSLDASGNLVLKIGGDEIGEHKPVVYQNVRGVRKEIEGAYRVTGDSTVSFRLGDYDRSVPLIIDPVLVFSSYLGGSKMDIGWSIALDPGGNIYIAGETLSKLATTNAFQATYQGGNRSFGDAFIAKYDNSGSNLLYLTYLGGRRDDGALGIAVDAAGYAYVTGFTDSPNFPVTNAPFRSAITGKSNNAVHIPPVDAFVAKLNTNGASLIFSTFIGGDGRDEGVGIAVDGSAVYVTGLTESTNLVPIPNGYQTASGGRADAFVVKFNNDGTTNGYYSTYLGGTNGEYAESIAVDGAGSAYVTGFTSSTNFPVTNAIVFNGITYTNLNGQTNLSLHTDAFISRLSADGASLIFSTLLGGSNEDAGLHIALDTAGNAYVAGYTFSTNFPTTTQLPHNPVVSNFVAHAFVTKVDPNDNLIYSTQFGGNKTDQAIGIAVDAAGNAYVAGIATSTNFFTTNTFGFLSPTNSSVKRFGTSDGFIAELDPAGSNFVFSAYLGGPGQDQINGIVVDPAGAAAYIVGQTTSSTNFPLVNPQQTQLGGVKKSKISDAFVGKIQLP